jgi:hypothetical protein
LAGIYSNLALNEESGDLPGIEIMLVPTGAEGQYHAFVQLAEGGLPLVAMADIQVKRNAFEFRLEIGSGLSPLKFQCTFKGEGMECTNGETKDVLKRGKSYWQ